MSVTPTPISYMYRIGHDDEFEPWLKVLEHGYLIGRHRKATKQTKRGIVVLPARRDSAWHSSVRVGQVSRFPKVAEHCPEVRCP